MNKKLTMFFIVMIQIKMENQILMNLLKGLQISNNKTSKVKVHLQTKTIILIPLHKAKKIKIKKESKKSKIQDNQMDKLKEIIKANKIIKVKLMISKES